MKVTLRKPRNAIEAWHVCRHKARYSTEEAARKTLEHMERTKVNPGALAVFACLSCNGWHLGTAFGPNPRAINRTRAERKRAKARRKAKALNAQNSHLQNGRSE